jgi:heat shock protein HtpX
MIAALEALRRHAGGRSDLPEQLNAFGIAGGAGRFSRWFSSHPPIEERIERLRNAA